MQQNVTVVVLAAGGGTRMKSKTMKVLHEVGLLNRSKRGVWVYYGIESAVLAQLAAVIADPTL